MKSVLISIQPYWVFLIIARLMGWNIPQEKTVEIRKDYPKASDWDKRVHIYCSKSKKSFNRIPKQYQPLMAKLLGKVIGEFVCDSITQYESEFWDDETYEAIHQVYEPLDFEEYGEYERELIATNDDDNRLNNPLFKGSCLSWEEMRKYIGQDIHTFYGWHISDIKIYDIPKDLNEFSRYGAHIRGGCCIKDNCKHYISNGYFEPPECSKEGCTITRPFQSWGYVEQ